MVDDITPGVRVDSARPRHEVKIGTLALPGIATPPAPGSSWVVFAHGSGSSRNSPRNQRVATVLQRYGLGTLLFDLLAADEADDRRRVFDIGLLATRLLDALAWLAREIGPGGRVPALFGASTGAAAALWAAAERPAAVSAVVTRGGRVDLARERLPRVRAPTLLIVGGHDREVLRLNREALPLLGGERRLEVVPGAGHLFEEPGALESMAYLTAEWFANHLSVPPA